MDVGVAPMHAMLVQILLSPHSNKGDDRSDAVTHSAAEQALQIHSPTDALMPCSKTALPICLKSKTVHKRLA